MTAYPYRYRRSRLTDSSMAGPALAVLLLVVLARGGLHPSASHGTAAASTRPAGYVNPLKGGSWIPARTDQGIDYKPGVPEPVRAIGDGTVVYSSTTDCPPSGWPGCAVIGYRLASGRAAGAVVFVAEHLTGLVPAGTRVRAGQPVATAWPGYPWIETGWANCAGSGPAVHYNGAADGTPMAGGLAFARFLRKLGAATLQDPGPGPDVVRGC